jgi:ATP-dependent helicase HrpA
VRWLAKAEREGGSILRMREADLLRDPLAVRDDGLPDAIDTGAVTVPVRYEHAPGSEIDGATIRVPRAALAGLDVERLSWGLPGHLVARIEALIRTLPKHIRVRLQPARQVAEGAAESLAFGEGSLTDALASHCSGVAGLPISATDFAVASVDPHLSIRIEIIGPDGHCIASGRDVTALAAAHRPDAKLDFAALAAACASRVVLDGTVPDRVSMPCADGLSIDAYAALAPPESRAPVTLHPTPWEAFIAHREAAVAHVVARINAPVRRIAELSRDWIAAATMAGAHGIAMCVARRAIDESDGIPRSAASLRAIGDAVRDDANVLSARVSEALHACRMLSESLSEAREALEQSPHWVDAHASALESHLKSLVPDGAVAHARWERVCRLPLWVSAIPIRLRKCVKAGRATSAAVEGSDLWRARSGSVARAMDQGALRLAAGVAPRDAWRAIEAFRDLVEEHVLSTHAQEVPTARPAGASRLERAWYELTRAVRIPAATTA